jgi:ABC-type multidrug transport system ATPase subunit
MGLTVKSFVARSFALGKTIVPATHYLDEAEWLADRVAIVRSGRIQVASPVCHVARRPHHYVLYLSETSTGPVSGARLPCPGGERAAADSGFAVRRSR